MTVAEREHHTTGFGIVGGWARFVAFWVALAAIVTEVVLALRLVLLAGAANASSGFVTFIYDVTGPLIQPFGGITASPTLDSGGIFESATVFAMGVYLLAALLVVAILMGVGMAPVAREDDEVIVEGRRAPDDEVIVEEQRLPDDEMIVKERRSPDDEVIVKEQRSLDDEITGQ